MVAIAIVASALAMSAIVGVRYLLVSGVFAAATRARHPGLYDGLSPQIRREIGWSLASALIYGVPAGVLAWGWQQHGWTLIYRDVHAYPLWYLPLSVLLYLFAHDTWFYWTHRMMHHPALFRWFHRAHHRSHNPSPWAAYAFSPLEALMQAMIFPLAVGLYPMHLAAFGLFMLWQLTFNVIGHTGYEIYPRRMMDSWLGKVINTPTHHVMHHETSRGNYGLYFNVWDRLMGTNHDRYEERFRAVTAPDRSRAAVG
jgi:sterol desaturase/sphingolipid hydroxylase (fatty acid hydroxylase superfamily)